MQQVKHDLPISQNAIIVHKYIILQFYPDEKDEGRIHANHLNCFSLCKTLACHLKAKVGVIIRFFSKRTAG